MGGYRGSKRAGVWASLAGKARIADAAIIDAFQGRRRHSQPAMKRFLPFLIIAAVALLTVGLATAIYRTKTGNQPTSPRGPSHVPLPVKGGHRLNEGDHGPGGGENDHCEKNKLGGHTWLLASRVAFAQEAKGAQAQRMIRFKQPTVGSVTA